jgi:hypothetical protein
VGARTGSAGSQVGSELQDSACTTTQPFSHVMRLMGVSSSSTKVLTRAAAPQTAALAAGGASVWRPAALMAFWVKQTQ